MNVNMLHLSTSLVMAKVELQAIVREHGPDGSYFKVGMSVQPVRRVVGVKPTFLEPGGKPGSVGKMNRTYRWSGRSVTTLYYLFQTPSRFECQKAERDLIEELELLAPDACLNRAGGGGGRPARQGPYFVYLARS